MEKGQAPHSFVNGKLEKYNFRNRTPEERREIARRSVEKRKRNKEQKLALQHCMKTLLNMDIKSHKAREALREFGVQDEDLTNQTLLMVSLFKKGTSGDVQATKEIIAMMDKLDMYKQEGKIMNDVTINLVVADQQDMQSDDTDVWDAEYEQQEQELLESEMNFDDEWGDEVYTG